MQLIAAALIGTLVFGEVLDPWTALGGAIITAATLYIARREGPLAAGEGTPLARPQHPVVEGEYGEGDDDDAHEIEDRAGPQHLPDPDGAAAEDDGVGRRGDRQHESKSGEEGDRQGQQ